jgi:hypothetical protein
MGILAIRLIPESLTADNPTIRQNLAQIYFQANLVKQMKAFSKKFCKLAFQLKLINLVAIISQPNLKALILLLDMTK